MACLMAIQMTVTGHDFTAGQRHIREENYKPFGTDYVDNYWIHYYKNI